MRFRQYSRSVLAVVAAYAVALQAVLLVVAGPLATGDFFAAPICSHSGAGGGGGSPAPGGHGCDCVANCLAGCCGAAAALLPETAGSYAPRAVGAQAAALDPVPTLRLNATGAHRSRAPPLR